MKNIKKIGSAILLVLLLLGGAFFYQSRELGPTKTVRGELQAIHSGELNHAYYLFTSSSYQANMNLAEFKEFVQTHPILSHLKTVELYGEHIKGNQGSLVAELTTQNDAVHPVLFRLTKEKDGWKIDQMRFINTQVEMGESAPIATLLRDTFAAFRKNNIEEIYQNYLAPEFKQTTTAEAFESTLQKTPQLTHFQAIELGDLKEENGLTRQNVHLEGREGPLDVTLWLAKRENGWKIWAIETNKEAAPTAFQIGEIADASDSKTEVKGTINRDAATEVIQNQLDALKSGAIDKAYSNFTSPEFTKATSLEAFKQFLSTYPEMAKFSAVKFGEMTSVDGVYLIHLTLTSEKGNSELDYWVSEDKGQWKIWGIRMDSSVNQPPLTSEEIKGLQDVIQKQLEVLKAGDTKSAYENFGSTEFKKNTSYEDFQRFLKEYPIFVEEKSFVVGEGVKEGDVSLLRVALQSPDETAEVDYRFIQEGDEWKIWGIQILKNTTELPQNKDEVKGVIAKQIEAIRGNDIQGAYEKFSSKQFQEGASLDKFTDYIHKHLELGQNLSYDIQEIQFKPNYVVVKATLTAKDKKSEKYEWRLIYENHEWKVLSIKMVDELSQKGPREHPMEFTQAVIGTQVDLQGKVTNPAKVFAPDDQQISVNLYVKKALSGDSVEVVLEHMDTRSSIPTITAEIEKVGDSVVNLIFTAPSQGWPVGEYRLHVKGSDGTSVDFPFTVAK